MPTQDPTAPRKKRALKAFAEHWNKVNPGHPIVRPPGVDLAATIIGTPARTWVARMQTECHLPVTRKFDLATMRKLLPPGIRGEVMAIVHSQVGEHEWPPGSNMGEIVKYLSSVGLSGGYAWCAAFVTWDLHKANFKHFPPNPASADSWGRWAKTKGLTKPKASSLYGDLWCWEWGNSDGMLDHIGFCDEGIKGTTAWYVDGNVGAYGGSVTDASRAAGNIAVVIDLVKLHNLK